VEGQLMIINAWTQNIMLPHDYARYQRLWNAPLSANHGRVVAPTLLSVAQILHDYTDGDSQAKRMLFFHFKRRHVSAVTTLIHDICSGIMTYNEVKIRLVEILNRQEINPQGSLFQRVGFIMLKLQEGPKADESLEEAHQYAMQ